MAKGGLMIIESQNIFFWRDDVVELSPAADTVTVPVTH